MATINKCPIETLPLNCSLIVYSSARYVPDRRLYFITQNFPVVLRRPKPPRVPKRTSKIAIPRKSFDRICYRFERFSVYREP